MLRCWRYCRRQFQASEHWAKFCYATLSDKDRDAPCEFISTVANAATAGANGDGKGVLEIEIAPDAYVKTWNNAFSDTFDKTLFDPSNPVFAAASQLANGQSVVFSGTFLKASGSSSGECVNESSITLDGKIKEPEFIFRFSAIAPQ